MYLQERKNPYDPGNAIVPFDIKNLGTLVKKSLPGSKVTLTKYKHAEFFNRNPIPKKRIYKSRT